MAERAAKRVKRYKKAYMPDVVGGSRVKVDLKNLCKRPDGFYFGNDKLELASTVGDGTYGTVRCFKFAHRPGRPPVMLKDFKSNEEDWFRERFTAMCLAQALTSCELVHFRMFANAEDYTIEVALEACDGDVYELMESDAGQMEKLTHKFVAFVENLLSGVDTFNQTASKKAYICDLKLKNVGVVGGSQFRLLDLDGINHFPGSLTCLYALVEYDNLPDILNRVLWIDSRYAAAGTLCEWLHDVNQLYDIPIEHLWFDKIDFEKYVENWTEPGDLGASLTEKYETVFRNRVGVIEEVMEVARQQCLEPAVRVLTAGIEAIKEAAEFIPIMVGEDKGRLL